MEEKRRYKRFELVLKVAVNKHEGEIVNISRFGLLASVVFIGSCVSVGDTVSVKISMPDGKVVACEGLVRHVAQKGNVWVIGVEIKAMDPSAKSDVLELAYKAWGRRPYGRG